MGREKKEFADIAARHNVEIKQVSNGHLYSISNRQKLGLSEVEIMQTVHNAAKEMLDREIALSERGFFDFEVNLIDSNESVSIDRFSRYATATLIVNVATE